jgi:hypothetical protein
MKKESKIRSTENGVEISINVLFPLKNSEASEINTEEIRQRNQGFALDVIGSYREYLIKVLNNRMQACVNNLFNHRDDVVFNDGQQIVYKRKDGSHHSFNVPSYMQMQDCLFALEHGMYKDILRNKVWIDQIIKAICNEPDVAKEDKGTIKFSDLISVLCEIHSMEFAREFGKIDK